MPRRKKAKAEAAAISPGRGTCVAKSVCRKKSSSMPTFQPNKRSPKVRLPTTMRAKAHTRTTTFFKRRDFAASLGKS